MTLLAIIQIWTALKPPNTLLYSLTVPIVQEMLPIGVLGINFKTAGLALREVIARSAETLTGERAIFFRHPVVVLSTCNRTEVYFSAANLAEAHSDLLVHLRQFIEGPFEHCLYSYFGNECFTHLCRVVAGLDSAIVAETEIQRQVKEAYAHTKWLPSCLHYAFQKALKVGKLVRTHLERRNLPTLYERLWQLAVWNQKRILLVGYSEINRGFLSFLMHRGIKDIVVCTQNPASVQGVCACDRNVLRRWQDYDVIVSASRAEAHYLIEGAGDARHTIFDLSVPRTVDPDVGNSTTLYNIDQCVEQGSKLSFIHCESLIVDNVAKLVRIYAAKTRHVLETVGMESHL